MNTFKWLLKREFWEHKGGFLWLPIIVGAIMTAFIGISLLIALSGMNDNMKINGIPIGTLAKTVGPEQVGEFAAGMVAGYPGLTMPILAAFGICAFFFCLNALYDERKDRSVLFWKSLPLSDSETVLSKVAMAIGVAPVIALVVATITAIVAAVLICLAAAIAGVNIFGALLGSSGAYLAPLQLAAMLPIYSLWALPTIGWLLMVSAWARTKPFLWALGVPLLTGTLLTWANRMFRYDWNMPWFWENIVGRLLGSVLPGSWMGQVKRAVPESAASTSLGDVLTHSWQLLAAPNIWIGVVIGAAMIYVAIRLRGWRDEG